MPQDVLVIGLTDGCLVWDMSGGWISGRNRGATVNVCCVDATYAQNGRHSAVAFQVMNMLIGILCEVISVVSHVTGSVEW